MRCGMIKTRTLRSRKSRRFGVRTWLRDASGTTAVEFAIISVPFFMSIFGAIGLAMHFFTTSALEHAVDQAARKLRTGQAQTQALTNDQFRQEICDSAFIDCSKVAIHISSDTLWTNVAPASCIDGAGDLAGGTGAGGDPVGDQGGCAGSAYVVTACYEWDLARIIPFLDIKQLNSGSGLIQASAAGRAEPHGFACP